MYDSIRGQMIADEVYFTLKGKVEEMFGDSVKLNRQEVAKINKTYDGVTFVTGAKVAPTLYLDGYVEQVEEGQLDMEEAATALMTKFMEHRNDEFDIPKVDAEHAQKSLYCVALSRERNAELLQSVPHRDIAGTDLAIVMRWQVQNIENAKASFLVKEEHLSAIGMTDAEAFEVAIPNTMELDPYSVESMRDIMRAMGMPEEMLGAMDGPEMLVIRNKSGVNGATGIFLDKELRAQISEYYKGEGYSGEFFILPSSTHEVICVPADNTNPKTLEYMIEEVNETQVLPEEQLGDAPYFCNSKLQLSMPTLADSDAMSTVAGETDSIGAHL